MAGQESFFFMADSTRRSSADRVGLHRPLQLAHRRHLAGMVNLERVTFYRQSDIPEIPELTWLLTCVTAKGSG